MYTTESQVEEFLREYFRSRVVSATMVRAVMKRALDNEAVFKKPFYEFSKENILKMYTAANVKSNRTLQNWNLTLKHASLWFLQQQGKELKSQYDLITREDLDTCIDEETLNQMLISKQQLYTIIDDLHNDTDKAILLMLFLGLGGDSLKELTFFTEQQLSRGDHCVYFKNGKVISITDKEYDIIIDGCRETELMSYSEEMRVVRVSGTGIFKYRSNTVNSNDNPNNPDDVRRRFRFIHRRINLVSEYLGIPMTPKSINASGLWHSIQEDMKQLDMSDLREYLATDNGRAVCWKYGFMGEHYAATVLDKFRKQI